MPARSKSKKQSARRLVLATRVSLAATAVRLKIARPRWWGAIAKQLPLPMAIGG